jgi:hypothetical protein
MVVTTLRTTGAPVSSTQVDWLYSPNLSPSESNLRVWRLDSEGSVHCPAPFLSFPNDPPLVLYLILLFAAQVAAGGDPAAAGNHGKAAVATTAAPKAHPMGCWAMRDKIDGSIC